PPCGGMRPAIYSRLRPKIFIWEIIPKLSGAVYLAFREGSPDAMTNQAHNPKEQSMQGRKKATAAALASAALACAPALVHAQAVVMAGSYQNFDVLNNTGGEACGFEMEVHGVSSSQLTRIFPSNFNPSVIRYGFGTAT